jgi:hypothetical protein
MPAVAELTIVNANGESVSIKDYTGHGFATAYTNNAYAGRALLKNHIEDQLSTLDGKDEMAIPNQGHFPLSRPRLRSRWFAQTLKQAASLRCVSSREKTNPRMVKRRNSPYASHDRSLKLNCTQKFNAHLLPPLPLTKRKWVSQAKKPLS